MSCSQGDRVEELTLGRMEGEDAAEVRAHLDECLRCQETAELLAEERALFERRALTFDQGPASSAPAPYFEPAAAPIRLLARARESGSAWVASMSSALVAAGACAAAIAGLVKVDIHPSGDVTNPSLEALIQSEDPAMTYGMSAAVPERRSMSFASRLDEALACAVPPRASVGIFATPAKGDEQLTRESVHATCEETVASFVGSR